MKKLRLFFSLFLALSTVALWAVDKEQYTIIVSLDGFRWDYCDTYDTPFLNAMAAKGVKAVMMPSFPSKTFPNHYTLATGLVPDHHGIIANSFKDRATGKRYSLGNAETRSNPAYYGGDPIWLTAKRQGVTTATVYWVGSDVAIKGDHAHYWHDYQKKPLLTDVERADEVLRLLQMPESERPHFIMCYFEEPDHTGHVAGPITRACRREVEHLDSLLTYMWNRISLLPEAEKINLIVTGDHGMAWTDAERTVPVKPYIKEEWVDAIEGDLPANIYVKQPQFADSIVAALANVDHIRVWRKADIPTYLQYGSNPNVGDVLVLPDMGWLFTDRKVRRGGSHGFDHTAADMHVGFRAMGPAFKVGYEKPDKFANVCIYPLLCHLLGVTPSPCDGSLDSVADMLISGN